MHIDFEKMNEESRELYEFMWGQEDNIPGDAGNLCQTYDKHHKKESKNSYSFFTGINNKDLVSKDKNINEANKKKVREYLLNIFNVENKAIFREKFDEVCSGSGGEVAKITCLHSSSLCGLLFFYNVKQKNLKLTLNGREISFDDVYFEFKNKVTRKGNPSNIDVVLISSTQHVILFLESKFSEYLTPKAEKIRNAYREEFGEEIYNEVFLEKIGMQFVSNKSQETDDKSFTIAAAPNRPAVYAAGIKQYISHFIGVRNYIQNGPYKTEDREVQKDDTKYQIYLGEILFDGFIFERGKKQLDNYTNHYKLLVDGLNSLKPNFNLLETPLKYSDLINDCEEMVRKYYFKNYK